MSSITFDTLAYVKKMKSVGFTNEQAEAQAEEIAKLLESQLVTKRDLQEAENRIIHELTLRIGTMIVAVAGLVIGIIEMTKQANPMTTIAFQVLATKQDIVSIKEEIQKTNDKLTSLASDMKTIQILLGLLVVAVLVTNLKGWLS